MYLVGFFFVCAFFWCICLIWKYMHFFLFLSLPRRTRNWQQASRPVQHDKAAASQQWACFLGSIVFLFFFHQNLIAILKSLSLWRLVLLWSTGKPSSANSLGCVPVHDLCCRKSAGLCDLGRTGWWNFDQHWRPVMKHFWRMDWLLRGRTHFGVH